MNKLFFLLSTFVAALIISDAAIGETGLVFESVVPGRSLSFPRDHGSHPRFATEWWYFTGHLTRGGEPEPSAGFQLTFFRVGVKPERETRSGWEAQSVYLAHLAFTDERAKRFAHFERASRGAFAEAGAREDTLGVWLRDWRAELVGDQIRLEAREGDYSLRLELTSRKPVTLHGETGYSAKGPNPGDASYYSSFTRLVGAGEMRLGESTTKRVTASVWMDHEFTSSSLARGTEGWDWFAIQLGSGEEIMVYQLRQKDGSPSPFSSGSIISANGEVRKLSREEFEIRPLATWKSEETGKTYPSKWEIRIPSFGEAMTVTPTLPNQELVTGRSTGVTYWEGRSHVRDNDGTLLGHAYVELVGY